MDPVPLSACENRLLSRARNTCSETYDPDWFDGGHIVAVALRTTSGALYDGVSLPATVGRASHCAEPSTISAAIADGHEHEDLDCCVAVAYDQSTPTVVPPCGACRELLVDYDIDVIVPIDGEPRRVAPAPLLPTRTW